MPDDPANNEVRRAEQELPAPKDTLESFFDWLSAKLRETECDHSLRLTMEFAKSNGIDEKRLCEWTKQYHGYCDCEVIWNVPDQNPVFRTSIS